MMKNNANSLKKSIIKICAVAFSVLCIGLSLLNYISYRTMLFSQYQDHMRNVLTNTACVIDTDDLAECIRTGKASEKYHALQAEMDERKDNTDLHFLYIIIPLNTDVHDNMRNVIAAMSREEYETIPDQMVKLNSLTGDSYTPDVAAKYLRAYALDEISYFENVTEWGDYYTAVMPLSDSEGNRIAELCVDIEMSEIKLLLLYHSLLTIGVTLLAGLLISLMFILWANKNVVRPIETLEQSVSDYTGKILKRDSSDLQVMPMPNVHTANEVASLAIKTVLMSEKLCSTANDMIHTQQRLNRMRELAHKDSLTQVGNKAAYSSYIDQLRQKVESGDARFAVVMADINLLKKINDTFGHEKGDRYIRLCCSAICDIYAHSPVFRVGGDEFVIYLTGKDYENRDKLLSEARERMTAKYDDPGLIPWENPSVSIGMAEYDPRYDESLEQVESRADRAMYAEKERIHKIMGSR